MSGVNIVKVLDPININLTSDGILNNYDATVDPTANDDVNIGYSIGSAWVNVVNDTTFRCTDDTPAAAVWVETSGGGGASASTEELLSTGWQGTPPVLSVNGSNPALFDHTGGMILVADHSTYPPVISEVVVPPAVGLSPTFIATETATFYSVNSSGTLVGRTERLTPTQRRSEATIGLVSHINNTVIDSVVNTPQVLSSVANNLYDLIRAIGFFSTSGNQIIGIPASLSVEKTLGRGFSLHENVLANPDDPHNFEMPALNPAVMIHITQTVVIDHIGANIDPTIWDNAGTITTVPANNDATIARVYIFPNNSIVYMLGQEVFNNFTQAKDAVGTEHFNLPPDIEQGALLLARVIMRKDATDITDPSESLIVPSTNISSGGATLTSLQQAYEISSEPEIETNDAQGALSVKRGTTGGDGDAVFEIVNGSDVVNLSIDGNGNITLSGTVDGIDIQFLNNVVAVHIADSSIHFTESSIDITNIDSTAIPADTLIMSDGTNPAASPFSVDARNELDGAEGINLAITETITNTGARNDIQVTGDITNTSANANFGALILNQKNLIATDSVLFFGAGGLFVHSAELEQTNNAGGLSGSYYVLLDGGKFFNSGLNAAVNRLIDFSIFINNRTEATNGGTITVGTKSGVNVQCAIAEGTTVTVNTAFSMIEPLLEGTGAVVTQRGFSSGDLSQATYNVHLQQGTTNPNDGDYGIYQSQDNLVNRFSGAQRKKYTLINAALDLSVGTAWRNHHFINVGNGTFNLTLPTTSLANQGVVYKIKKSGTGTLTIVTTGGDTKQNTTLVQHDWLEIVSDGAGAWITMAGGNIPTN